MSFQDLESGIVRPQPNNYFNSSYRHEIGDVSPSQSVAAGIFKIRTAILGFDRLVNSLGTPEDTSELRDKLHKTRLHIMQLVKEISAKLREASEADQDAEPLKKIADAKLAKDFQAALKDFQKAQRLAAEREIAYTPEVLPSRQEVVLMDNEITFNEAIIEERDQGIKEVQQQISEVNEIFKIRTAILGFDRLVNSLGTPRDTYELRDKLHKTRLHIMQLVKEISAKLREASEADHDAEPLKKIADAKLAKDFQAALKDFQKAQRLAAEREIAYTPEVLPSRQEVVLMDNEITFNEAIIEERDQGIKEVPQQINEVNEIFKIRTAILGFDRLVNSLGTPRDTYELRDKLHKTRLHIMQLVKEISAKLREASEADQDAEPLKKIADAKLAKDFQAALKDFQKAQRLAAERETAYTPFVPKDVLPSSYDAYEVEKSSSKSLEQQRLLVSKRQEVVLMDNEITFNEAIIEEIDQGIKEVPQQISEVNEIFKDLAVLVHEQGSMIDDIGSNIGNSHSATVQATSQLKKAS